MTEVIDHRYLGALRCVDRATGFRLTRLFRIESDDVVFIRNRSSLYVIAEAPGLAGYTRQFSEAPAQPAIGSVLINAEISDPLNRYLPRRLQIALPRDADPANHEQNDSLFQPLPVRLYAAPNASLQNNWSSVRVSVVRSGEGDDDEPVAGVLLRVIRNSDNEVLSSGLSDQRGEALVVVPGIPITRFADDGDAGAPGGGHGGGPGGGPGGPGNASPVVVSETAVTLEVSLTASPQWPVDPDELELNHSNNVVASENLTLRTGRMEKLTIQLTS